MSLEWSIPQKLGKFWRFFFSKPFENISFEIFIRLFWWKVEITQRNSCKINPLAWILMILAYADFKWPWFRVRRGVHQKKEYFHNFLFMIVSWNYKDHCLNKSNSLEYLHFHHVWAMVCLCRHEQSKTTPSN